MSARKQLCSLEGCVAPTRSWRTGEHTSGVVRSVLTRKHVARGGRASASEIWRSLSGPRAAAKYCCTSGSHSMSGAYVRASMAGAAAAACVSKRTGLGNLGPGGGGGSRSTHAARHVRLWSTPQPPASAMHPASAYQQFRQRSWTCLAQPGLPLPPCPFPGPKPAGLCFLNSEPGMPCDLAYYCWAPISCTEDWGWQGACDTGRRASSEARSVVESKGQTCHARN